MKVLSIFLGFTLISCNLTNEEPAKLDIVQTSKPTKSMSFYDLQATTIDGEAFPFESLRGKRVLIVNTASECGFTSQYKALQELHEKFGSNDFVILGFPSNDFGGQEPGTEQEIASFCTQNYGVDFQMMSKVSTSPSSGHDVYRWLCNSSLNGVEDAKVSWNFNKFLVDENGRWTAHYESRTDPMSEKITSFAAQN